MENAINFIFQIAILIFSVVIHEVSHGLMANALGDKTAKYAGRLTLNPIKHLDFFGSFLVPVFSYLAGGFILGWAKPVPYDPYNLKNQKWGSALVGAAGPASNLLIAIFFGLILRAILGFDLGNQLFILNLIRIFEVIIFLNLILAIFNLVPIPPLDGSKLLFALLPYQWRWIENLFEQYGFIVLLLFIFSFSGIILYIVSFLFRLITSLSF